MNFPPKQQENVSFTPADDYKLSIFGSKKVPAEITTGQAFLTVETEEYVEKVDCSTSNG